MKLEGDSLIPLYQQVINDIRSGIDDGRYAVGQKIPSESELSESYAVSRITIRRAIEELSSAGYLTKKQGKGTYVTSRKLESKITQDGCLTTFGTICEKAGRVAGARVIGCDCVPANDATAEALGIEEGTELLRIRRIRTSDGVPIVFETTYYPHDEYSFLEQEGLEGNLYDILERHGARAAKRVHDALIELVLANAETAEHLSVPLGEPLFSECGVITDGEGTPISVCDLKIVARYYAFRII